VGLEALVAMSRHTGYEADSWASDGGGSIMNDDGIRRGR
jgi:hypothetical protein